MNDSRYTPLPPIVNPAKPSNRPPRLYRNSPDVIHEDRDNNRLDETQDEQQVADKISVVMPDKEPVKVDPEIGMNRCLCKPLPPPPPLPPLPLVPVACGTTAKGERSPALTYSPEFFSVLKEYSREDQIYIIQNLHTFSDKPDSDIVHALDTAMRQIGNKSNIDLLIARTLNILKYPDQIDNYREGSAHETKIKTEDGPDGAVILAMIVSIGAVLGGIAMVICDPNFTLVMAMTYLLGGSFWIGVAGYMAKGCAVTVAILIIIMLCSEFTLAGWGILLIIGGIASLIALATRDKD